MNDNLVSDDNSGRSLRFLVPLTLVGIGVILFAGGFRIQILQAWLKSCGMWAPVAFVPIAIGMMSVVVPKTAVSLTAGMLFGTGLGIMLMMVAGPLGASMNYGIGRWWLRDAILRKLKAEKHPKWLASVYQLGSDAGFGLHFLIRLAPIPTMVISYTMGALNARFWPYLSAAILGAVPQVLWVHSGSTLAGVATDDVGTLQLVSGGVSLAAALTIAVVVPRFVVIRMREQTLSDR